MRLEFLVEDQSGKKMLEILVPKIISSDHTFNIHAYKGIGRIPKGLKSRAEARKRILLDQLPRLVQGYGRTFAAYPADCGAALVLVCDLDDRCLAAFRREIFAVLDRCSPCPDTRFCVAIEEGEAWLLGDLSAIKTAYPKAKDTVLNAYQNDSICGTWERLADAVFSGGGKVLLGQGWQAVGTEKARWAERIAPHMEVSMNESPSFQYFRQKLLDLINSTED